MTTFSRFQYDRISLSSIKLDLDNPRIVLRKRPTNEQEIVEYLFKFERLGDMIEKIASQGLNKGAERPYVVRNKSDFTVIEGNRRIASYKLLTGVLSPPSEFVGEVQTITLALKEELSAIDCTIAPTRDSLLPIMANAHFGLGEKKFWSYLGSRKAVYSEWQSGKSVTVLSAAFGQKKSQLRNLLMEYKLYEEALTLDWTDEERQEIEHPSVEFNPPVRFLQTSGHKEAMGIQLDSVNIAVSFIEADSRKKYKHLLRKLVIDPVRGLGATAKYSEVFQDYIHQPPEAPDSNVSGSSDVDTKGDQTEGTKGGDAGGVKAPRSGEKTNRLFVHTPRRENLVLNQLMKEAREINYRKFPACSTALLRCIVEAILKLIIDEQGANKDGALLSLEKAIDICLGKNVTLPADDVRILKEFKRNHLDYINLGAHATVAPTELRLIAARSCIDPFVGRNV